MAKLPSLNAPFGARCFLTWVVGAHGTVPAQTS